jgi:ABC-type branched-subunit amino acid transport system substrate-binding protein
MTRFTHFFALLLCGAIAVFAHPALAQDVGAGEFASLTGGEATFGINSSNAVELAKEEINNSGGLLGGRKIKIIVEDAIKERSWQSLCWSICTSKTRRFSRM